MGHGARVQIPSVTSLPACLSKILAQPTNTPFQDQSLRDIGISLKLQVEYISASLAIAISIEDFELGAASSMKMRLPAEFERHSHTYLLWPYRPDNWRSSARYAQDSIASLANVIAQFEEVRLGYAKGINPIGTHSLHQGVHVFPIEYEDIWIRDTGPITIVKDGIPFRSVDFKFNSWGGLFETSAEDDAVAAAISLLENIPVQASDLVLEGGAIVTDGRGTIVTTEESILAANRNPTKTKGEIESAFGRLMGVDQIIWLPEGLANDEAGGHVDNVCAFADPKTILLAATNNPDHPSYHRLAAAREILAAARSSSGESYDLIEVPLPPVTEITKSEARDFDKSSGSIVRQAGTLLAPSHINFFNSNGAVIVPIFDCETDDAALIAIKQAFRNKSVVPFLSREFVLGGGGIHCLTKEMPAPIV